jgi:hypothetical protein
MELSLATNYFDTTTLDGWDGTSWTTGIALANLVVYDRFLSDRSFGQVKRTVTTGQRIPVQYICFRIEGLVYMLEGVNVDTREGKTYGWIYTLREARTTGSVIRLVDGVARASGISEKVPTVVHPSVFLDLDRFNSIGSTEVDSLRHPLYTAWMPQGTDLKTTDEMEIDGENYVVRERSRDMMLEFARLVKRSDM